MNTRHSSARGTSQQLSTRLTADIDVRISANQRRGSSYRQPSRDRFKRSTSGTFWRLLASMFAVVLASTMLLPNAIATSAQSQDNDVVTESYTLEDLLNASSSSIPVMVSVDGQTEIATFAGGALVGSTALTSGEVDAAFSPFITFTDSSSQVAAAITDATYLGASLSLGDSTIANNVVAVAQLDGQTFYALAGSGQATALTDGTSVVLQYTANTQNSEQSSEQDNSGAADATGTEESTSENDDSATASEDDAQSEATENGETDSSVTDGSGAESGEVEGDADANESDSAIAGTATDNDVTAAMEPQSGASESTDTTLDEAQSGATADIQTESEDSEAATPTEEDSDLPALSAELLSLSLTSLSTSTYAVDYTELGEITVADKVITWEIDGESQNSPEYLYFKGGEIRADTVAAPQDSVHFVAAYVVLNGLRYEIDSLGSIADTVYFHALDSDLGDSPILFSSSLPDDGVVVFSFSQSQYYHDVTGDITGDASVLESFADEQYGFVNLPDSVAGGTELTFQFERAVGMEIEVIVTEGENGDRTLRPTSTGGGSAGRTETYAYDTGNSNADITIQVTVSRHVSLESVKVSLTATSQAASFRTQAMGSIGYKELVVAGNSKGGRSSELPTVVGLDTELAVTTGEQRLSSDEEFKVSGLYNTFGQRRTTSSDTAYNTYVPWLSKIVVTHTTTAGKEITETVDFPNLDSNAVEDEITTVLTQGDAAGTKVTVTLSAARKVTVGGSTSIQIPDYDITVTGMKTHISIEVEYAAVYSQQYVFISSWTGVDMYVGLSGSDGQGWTVLSSPGWYYNIGNGFGEDTDGLKGRFCFQLQDGYVNPVVTIDGKELGEDSFVTVPWNGGPEGYSDDDSSWYCFSGGTVAEGNYYKTISVAATAVSYQIDYATSGLDTGGGNWSGTVSWTTDSWPTDGHNYGYDNSVFQISSNIIPTTENGYFRYYQIRINGELLNGEYYPGQTVDIYADGGINSSDVWENYESDVRAIELVPVFSETAEIGNLIVGSFTIYLRQSDGKYAEDTQAVALPYGSAITLASAEKEITEGGITWQLDRATLPEGTYKGGARIASFYYEKVQTISYEGLDDPDTGEYVPDSSTGLAFVDKNMALVTAEDLEEANFIPAGYRLLGWKDQNDTEYLFADDGTAVLEQRPWDDLTLTPVFHKFGSTIEGHDIYLTRTEIQEASDSDSLADLLRNKADVAAWDTGGEAIDTSKISVTINEAKPSISNAVDGAKVTFTAVIDENGTKASLEVYLRVSDNGSEQEDTNGNTYFIYSDDIYVKLDSLSALVAATDDYQALKTAANVRVGYIDTNQRITLLDFDSVSLDQDQVAALAAIDSAPASQTITFTNAEAASVSKPVTVDSLVTVATSVTEEEGEGRIWASDFSITLEKLEEYSSTPDNIDNELAQALFTAAKGGARQASDYDYDLGSLTATITSDETSSWRAGSYRVTFAIDKTSLSATVTMHVAGNSTVGETYTIFADTIRIAESKVGELATDTAMAIELGNVRVYENGDYTAPVSVTSNDITVDVSGLRDGEGYKTASSGDASITFTYTADSSAKVTSPVVIYADGMTDPGGSLASIFAQDLWLTTGEISDATDLTKFLFERASVYGTLADGTRISASDVKVTVDGTSVSADNLVDGAEVTFRLTDKDSVQATVTAHVFDSGTIVTDPDTGTRYGMFSNDFDLSETERDTVLDSASNYAALRERAGAVAVEFNDNGAASILDGANISVDTTDVEALWAASAPATQNVNFTNSMTSSLDNPATSTSVATLHGGGTQIEGQGSLWVEHFVIGLDELQEKYADTSPASISDALLERFFELAQGQAVDANGGEITINNIQVSVSPTGDTWTAGTYQVTFTVKDTNLTGTVTMRVASGSAWGGDYVIFADWFRIAEGELETISDSELMARANVAVYEADNLAKPLDLDKLAIKVDKSGLQAGDSWKKAGDNAWVNFTLTGSGDSDDPTARAQAVIYADGATDSGSDSKAQIFAQDFVISRDEIAATSDLNALVYQRAGVFAVLSDGTVATVDDVTITIGQELLSASNLVNGAQVTFTLNGTNLSVTVAARVFDHGTIVPGGDTSGSGDGTGGGSLVPGDSGTWYGMFSNDFQVTPENQANILDEANNYAGLREATSALAIQTSYGGAVVDLDGAKYILVDEASFAALSEAIANNADPDTVSVLFTNKLTVNLEEQATATSIATLTGYDTSTGGGDSASTGGSTSGGSSGDSLARTGLWVGTGFLVLLALVLVAWGVYLRANRQNDGYSAQYLSHK